MVLIKYTCKPSLNNWPLIIHFLAFDMLANCCSPEGKTRTGCCGSLYHRMFWSSAGPSAGAFAGILEGVKFPDQYLDY